MRILVRLPAELADRLKRGLHTESVTETSSWSTLLDSLRQFVVAAVVIDPCMDSVSNRAFRPHHDLDAVLNSSRSIPLLIYSRLSPAAMFAIAYVSRKRHVDGLILAGHSDDRVLLDGEVRRVTTLQVPDGVTRELSSLAVGLPPTLARTVTQLFARPDQFHTVVDLAGYAHSTRRTLGRQLRRAGLSGPKDLIRTARVVHAYNLMRDPKVTAKCAARTLGYQKYDHFISDVRRIAGCTPAILRGSVDDATFAQYLHFALRLPPRSFPRDSGR